MKTTFYSWPNVLALTLCLFLGAGCSKASKARRVLAAADRDFQATNYDKAEAEYKSALRLSSLDPVAIRQLGLIYFEEGRQPQPAFAFLKKANELDNKNTQVQLKLAELYGSTGGTNAITNAIALLKSVLQSDPVNEHAWHLLVQLAPTNELASLRQQLEAQLREGGQDLGGCHSALGWIYLRMQKQRCGNRVAKGDSAGSKTAVPLPRPWRSSAPSQHDPRGIQDQASQNCGRSSPRFVPPSRLKYVDFEMQAGSEEQARQVLLDITRQGAGLHSGVAFFNEIVVCDPQVR
jgi:tetratricopeptide (TPR) repeat protein